MTSHHQYRENDLKKTLLDLIRACADLSDSCAMSLADGLDGVLVGGLPNTYWLKSGINDLKHELLELEKTLMDEESK